MKCTRRLLFYVLVAGLGGAWVGTGCGSPESTPEPDVVGDASSDGQAEDVGIAELPSEGCESDEECAPEEGIVPACQVPKCEDGTCVYGDLDNGTECDDETGCTLEDACQDGVCSGEPLDCDDENPCTTDGCDPIGECVHTFNQKPCDDGDACSTEDACFQGECSGKFLSCDDGNGCTTDVCDVVIGCIWEAHTQPCDDGDACSVGDACSEGACVSGLLLDCDAAGPCVDGYCDPVEGCITTVLQDACDDNNACTAGDTCKDGACVGDTVVCDDANPCTDDFCSPATGCNAVDNKAPCDDGQSCTLADACSGGACVPGDLDPLCCVADDTCDDGDPCTDDSCQAGYCLFAEKNCDDGTECTADVCADGLCSHNPMGLVAQGVVLSADFDGATPLAGWQIVTNNLDVTWQLDDLKALSGSKSLYFGNPDTYTYDFGVTKATASLAVSVPPGSAELSLWLTQDVAEIGCGYDSTRLLIDGEVQLPEICDDVSNWTEFTYDLSAWNGQTVTLGLEFDTVDNLVNDGLGVWIDNIELSTDALLNCCIEDTDCGGGTGCLLASCDSVTYKCTVGASDAACDDEDADTLDACEADGSCSHTPIGGCCESDADCADEDPCTEEQCDACDCFVTPVDCDDGDDCTSDACQADGTCENADIEGCCAVAADCPDDAAAPCKVPECDAGSCTFDESTCE